MPHRLLSAACVLLTLSTLGCGGSNTPETAPVEGTVLYKGQPVEGANVSFFTEGAPRAGYAVTDGSGKFVISTFGARDGAIVGDHVVTVSKAGEQAPAVSSTQPPKPEEMMKSYLQNYKQKPENKLPAKYASKEQSPLKFTVVKDVPNNFTIELTD